MIHLHSIGNKTQRGLVAVLVLLGPLHVFLVTWLKIPGLSVWREVAVFLIGVLALRDIFKKERRKLDALDAAILAYGAVALLWLPFQEKSVQWLLGFRYDVLPWIFFMMLRRTSLPAYEKLRKIALAMAGAVLVFGLLQAAVLPKDFLTHFGYAAVQTPYEAGRTITGCQHLEGTDRVCRAIGTFGGPSRYGTYLLLILGLIFPLLLKPGKSRSIGGTLATLALLSIVLTYSRSIWLGALALGFGGIFWLWKGQEKSCHRAVKLGVAIGAVCLIGALSLVTLRFSSHGSVFFQSLFQRSISTNEHWASMKKGVEVMKAHPLGVGLGKIGPASLRFQKNLTENWFLQIGGEMGIIGLALFCTILFLMLRALLRTGAPEAAGLAFFLAGVATAGIFSHSFEETTTILLFMIFAAPWTVQSASLHA